MPPSILTPEPLYKECELRVMAKAITGMRAGLEKRAGYHGVGIATEVSQVGVPNGCLDEATVSI